MITMTQQEFIWEMRTFNTTQHSDGTTVAQLRPQVRITHNFRRRNIMHIIFDDENVKYIIPGKVELLFIIRKHIEFKEATQPMKDYCQKYLVKD